MAKFSNGRGSKYGGRVRPSWDIFNVLRHIDTFGTDIHAFNIKG